MKPWVVWAEVCVQGMGLSGLWAMTLCRLSCLSFGGAGAQHADPFLGPEALGPHDHEWAGGTGMLPGLPAPGPGHAEQQSEPCQV